MSEFFRTFKKNDEPWRFVGTVLAPCEVKQDDGTKLNCGSFINLYEKDSGARTHQIIGDLQRYTSPASRLAHAQVLGWEAGGPLPPIEWGTDDEDEHQAELIVFPGGRDGAA